MFSDEAQMQAELRAAELMASQEVKAAQAKLRREVYSPRAAGSRTRQQQLDLVIEEVAFAGTLWASTNNPNNPNVIWFNNPPHETRGIAIPGGRFGTDNPDRIYRYFAVDTAYAYELQGKRDIEAPPFQFFLEACEDKPAAWGYPLRFLKSHEIVYEPDGSFVITLDTSPANGRQNHLQLPEGTGHIMVRDTLVDWAKERPTRVTVRRVSGPKDAPKPTPEAVKSRLEKAIIDQSFFGLEWEDHPVLGLAPVTMNGPLNVFVRPSAPGEKAWGMTGPGRAKVEDDEALVLTIEKQSADYISVQVTDPWLLSRDYVARTGSLNAAQVYSNPDETITYVISKQDPGVQNWLDTAGLSEVAIMLRMEAFEAEPNPETVIQQMELVNLKDLAAALPDGTPAFSAGQRAAQIAARKAGYARRLKVLTPSR